MKINTESLIEQDLKDKLAQAGYDFFVIKHAGKNNDPLLRGELCFKNIADGLSVHCGKSIETSNSISTCELTDVISINFLFEGEITFSVSDKKYQFHAKSSPQLFVNVLSGTHSFSRFLFKNNNVFKLNLTLTRDWLLKRCTKASEQMFVSQLFDVGHSVYSCEVNNRELILAKKICELHHQASIFGTLSLESNALKIISYVLAELKKIKPVKCQEYSNERVAVRRRFDKEIIQASLWRYSLKHIAKQLGTSESTLRRYFKQQLNTTASEFVREKRLEYARRMLVVEQKTIGETAYFSGYNHVSNFITAFRKQFSITPKELLARHNL